MTIQPVSTSAAVSSVAASPPKNTPASQKPQPMPQDTVHLSAQAKQAMLDQDHDGDSR
jgi:hypothetical protein